MGQTHACIAIQSGQSLPVACVGELVDINDEFIALSQPVDYAVATDEAGVADN